MVNRYGTSGSEALYGSTGNDVIYGFAGNDSLYSNYGNDYLNGGDGNDYLDGGYGFDTLDGGAGYDIASYTFYNGGIVANLATGIVSFPGNSTQTDRLLNVEGLYGSTGSDTLYGNSGYNYLDGSDGNDLLFGDAANDTLLGNNGNDVLLGGWGGTDVDILYGGIGQDLFVLDSNFGQGYSIIADWAAGSDRIAVTGGASQYQFRTGNFGVGSTATDFGIYYNNDLVAIVQDSTNVSISRDFTFL